MLAGTTRDLATGAGSQLLYLNQDQSLYLVDPSGTPSASQLFDNSAASGPLPGMTVQGVGLLDVDSAILAASFLTQTPGNAGGIFRYDLGSGLATPIAQNGLMIGNQQTDFMTPDQVVYRNGKIYVASSGLSQGSLVWRIVAVDAITGTQTLIKDGSGRLGDFDVSLDGNVAFITRVSPVTGTAPSRLLAIDVTTGNQTEYSFTAGPTGGVNGYLAVVAPEPGSAALLALGLIGLAGRRRTHA